MTHSRHGGNSGVSSAWLIGCALGPRILCGPDDGAADAGAADAGAADAGKADAGAADAGKADAGKADAGAADAGKADAGAADAGKADAPARLFDYDKLEPDLQKVVSRKKWENASDPMQLLKDYAGLEKLVGANPMPRPEADKLDEYFKTNAEVFGVPDAPDKYEIKRDGLAEGQTWDEGFETEFRAFAHSIGMPGAMATRLGDFFRDHATKAFSAAQDAGAEYVEKERGALNAEWGDKADENRAAAKAGLRWAGLDDTAIDAFETVAGYSGAMKAFAKIGAALGEDTLDLGGSSSLGGLDPQSAKAEWQRTADELGKLKAAGMMKTDPKWIELEAKQKTLAKVAFKPDDPAPKNRA